MNEAIATINRTDQGDPARLIDAKQAAEILQVCPRTIARMCERGEIKAVKVRSLWRINRDALLDFAGLR